MSFKRALSSSGLILGLALMAPSMASAVEYGGVGGRPANPVPGNDRTTSIFVHEIAAGANVADGVRIINNTGETKTLLVDAVDSVASSGGAFACAQRVEDKKAVGSWIKLEQTEVTLEPMSNVVVPFDISVPEMSDVGEHDGCIVIQEKMAAPEKQGGIQLSFRTGIRVAVLVPGEIVRHITIKGNEIDTRGDRDFRLASHVSNDGNVSVDADVRAEVANLLGMEKSSYGGVFPVLRGQTSDYSFDMAKPFWGGWYRYKLTVSYDAHSGARIGTDSGEGRTTLNGTDIVFYSVPAPQAAAIEGLVLLVILAIITLLCMKAAQRRKIAKTWVAYAVMAGEDLNAIAAKHGITWKALAEANHLKPPFSVKVGDSLKVPPPTKKS